MHTLEAGENGYDGFKKAQNKQIFEKECEEINKLLNSQRADDPYLDLSNRNLSVLPSELFVLAHIQHLYLEKNFLESLPENFFDRLPALQWLDLRNNQLSSLPSSIGRHQCIKNLLLEGNKLTQLPPQLGMAKTLSGLSLQGNPLQHPPQHIVDQGMHVILSFLYQELQNRSRKPAIHAVEEIENLKLNDSLSDTSEDVEILTQDINLADRQLNSPMSDDYQLLRNNLTPMTASLHKPLTYQDYKGRFQSSKVPESLVGNRAKSNKDLSLLHLKHHDDTRQEQLRLMKERQNAFADQRRKSVTTEQQPRNNAQRRLPSTPDIQLRSTIQSLEPCSFELHSDVREEKVERVLPDKRIHHLQISRKTRYLNLRKSIKTSKSDLMETEKVGDGLTGLTVCGKKIRGVASCHHFSDRTRGYLPNSDVKNNNELLQRRIREHSREIQTRMKQMRAIDNEDLTTNKEFQRQLLEEKMRKQVEMDYRFRAFTGDSYSTKSDSQKTTSA